MRIAEIMRCRAARPLVVLAAVLLVVSLSPAVGQEPVVAQLEIDGPIGPATADYVERGLAEAVEMGAAVAILRMDTPGGLDQSMRQIVRDVLASPIPVVGFVAPSGARAASAGTYILYASHVAAMAPGSNLGAATPVQLGGGDGEDEADGGVGMHDKMVNDAVAYIRSLAELRGRNAEWAEQAVREAASLTANRALELDVIDLVARDQAALLAALDGREVEIGGVTRRITTQGASVVDLAPDWRARLLGIITNPTVAYLLMLVGIYGIIFEFYSPGLVGPGLVGTISLLLALYAFQILPVDWTGLALIGLGLALMAAEGFTPAFGLLGVAGIASFVIGSLILYDRDIPGFAVALPVLLAFSIGAAATTLALALVAARSWRRPRVSGDEQMMRERASVVEWSGGTGSVRVHGEVWSAVGEPDLVAGEAVHVVARDGLTVRVARSTNS